MLHAIRILIFVYVNKAEALLPGGAGLVEAAKRIDRAQEEIVEIERAGLLQELLVCFVQTGGFAGASSVAWARDSAGVIAVIFRITDARKDGARSVACIAHAQRGDRELDSRLLIIVVVNRKVARQSDASCFAPQQTHAKRVKCADPRIAGKRAAALQESLEAVAHLRGGFIGEGDCQNGIAGHAFLHHMGYAIGDDAGFSRAGAG